jgi:transposase InsO family protein
MNTREGFSIVEACRQAGVSRAEYYRQWEQNAPLESDVALRDAIQKIAVGNRSLGYRRVHAELKRQGWAVNHKRVLRLMREDNLLALRKQRFVLTTDSHHPFGIYPNLAPLVKLTTI